MHRIRLNEHYRKILNVVKNLQKFFKGLHFGSPAVRVCMWVCWHDKTKTPDHNDLKLYWHYTVPALNTVYTLNTNQSLRVTVSLIHQRICLFQIIGSEVIERATITFNSVIGALCTASTPISNV